jgi:hypothetical protein
MRLGEDVGGKAKHISRLGSKRGEFAQHAHNPVHNVDKKGASESSHNKIKHLRGCIHSLPILFFDTKYHSSQAHDDVPSFLKRLLQRAFANVPRSAEPHPQLLFLASEFSFSSFFLSSSCGGVTLTFPGCLLHLLHMKHFSDDISVSRATDKRNCTSICLSIGPLTFILFCARSCGKR